MENIIKILIISIVLIIIWIFMTSEYSKKRFFRKMVFEEYLKEITALYYIILILTIFAVTLLFVRIGGYLPERILEAHKYISGIFFVIVSFFSLFCFYLGYFKGIFMMGGKFIIDRTKIKKLLFLPYLISFLLSFLSGLFLLIYI
jgi:hypothetical protein